MRTKQKVRVIITTVVIVLLALLVGAYSAMKSCLAHNEFFGKAEHFVTKVDLPLSLEQAREELKFPLPDQASDIYYAHYHQWIAYDFMVKFHAPLDVCKSHARYIIQEYNNKNPDRHISGLTFFEDLSFPVVSSGSMNVAWFDLHEMKRGFVTGEGGPMQPMIWIDADRNIFYYRVMD